MDDSAYRARPLWFKSHSGNLSKIVRRSISVCRCNYPFPGRKSSTQSRRFHIQCLYRLQSFYNSRMERINRSCFLLSVATTAVGRFREFVHHSPFAMFILRLRYSLKRSHQKEQQNRNYYRPCAECLQFGHISPPVNIKCVPLAISISWS